MAVNGAAARLVQPGDPVIIIAYGLCTAEEARGLQPCVLLMGPGNSIAGRA